jgi:hypothetical protein
MDAGGGTATTTSTVTVTDTTPPVFDAVQLPDLSFTLCDKDGEITLDVPEAEDACIGPVEVTGVVIESTTVSVPLPVGTDGSVVLPPGNHIVRWTATDGITPSSLDQQVVVVPGIFATESVFVRNEGSAIIGGVANNGTVPGGETTLENVTSVGDIQRARYPAR